MLHHPPPNAQRAQSADIFKTLRAQSTEPFAAAPRKGRACSKSTLREGNPFNEKSGGGCLTLNLAKKLEADSEVLFYAALNMDTDSDRELAASTHNASLNLAVYQRRARLAERKDKATTHADRNNEERLPRKIRATIRQIDQRVKATEKFNPP